MKVGLVSHSYQKDKQTTIQKTLELIKKCVSDGAELVCLQELHQGFYFCQAQNVDNFDFASEYEKDVEFWSDVAKEHKIVLITSLFEKTLEGLYFNTAVVFDSDGSVAGKYRKMHIPDDPQFNEKFYFTPGDMGFEPIDTSLGRLGVLVCWDQWYPEAARIMALKGAKILFYPTAIGWLENDDEATKKEHMDAWLNVQRGHSIANALPLVAVNRVGFELASLSGHENPQKGIEFFGSSVVYDSFGGILFKQDSNTECAKVVDIDMQKCENTRRWWPFLRDRRIDKYEDLLKRVGV